MTPPWGNGGREKRDKRSVKREAGWLAGGLLVMKHRLQSLREGLVFGYWRLGLGLGGDSWMSRGYLLVNLFYGVFLQGRNLFRKKKYEERRRFRN